MNARFGSLIARYVLLCLSILLIQTHLLLAADAPAAEQNTVATIELTWHDTTRDRDVPVKIYYPKDLTTAAPVIIFSHGLGGSREGYQYLGEYWAGHGLVSVHLQHLGSDITVAQDAGAGNGHAALVQAANGKNAIARCKDVSFAIDQLEKLDVDGSSALKGRLNLKKIGMSGHSFGGGTTMFIAGQVATVFGKTIAFPDPRITAAIAMSPPAPLAKSSYDSAFSQIKIPVFVLTGTEDNSPIGKTTAEDRRIGYDRLTHAPAYLLTFAGGDHMLFSGKRRGPAVSTDDLYHQLILEGTTAFWNAYLLDDTKALAWFKDGGYARRVGSSGVFEEKHGDAHSRGSKI